MVINFKSLLVLTTIVLGVSTNAVLAKDNKKDKLSLDQIKAKITAAFPRAPIEKVEKGPVDGFYQVLSQGEMYYITEDGKHMFFGSLVSIAGGKVKNLTREKLAEIEAEKAPERAADIKALKDNDFVVFKAPSEKHKVTVFTDVDCGYCRKLHKEVKKLNELGVTVQYLAFPRAGIPSSSYDKLVSVWCAKNKTQAMDAAKLERRVEKLDKNNICENSIQSKHWPLVRKFGISGTPAILTEEGDIIAGYLPPEQLIARLEQLAKN